MFKIALGCVLSLTLVIGIFGQATVITVTNGETDGSWGPLETCPTGSRATSYQTQNEANAPITDDSALHTIALFCDDPDTTNITSAVGL